MLACAQYWQGCHEKKQPLLEVPVEVVKGGEDAVKSFLVELEKTGTDELVYRRKICVVGPSSWGKTSLIKSMTKEAPDLVPLADRTTGIDLFPLWFTEERDANLMAVKRHDVTFWDFAGQDIYHVAHAVFFSKRTMYLVCVDLKAYTDMLENAKKESKMQREKFKHRFFAKNILRWMVLVLFRQPEAQFKLIGTKHDEVSNLARIDAINDIKTRLNKFLKDPDGNVKITGDVARSLKKEFNQEVVTASVTSVESIQKVKDSIKSAIIAKSDLSFPMPATYTQVLNHIIQKRQSADSPTQKDRMDNVIVSVSELCTDLMSIPGLENADCQEILRVLHEFGDVLWYQESGEDFENWIILDPSVMLDLVREVVNHKYENEADGRYEKLRHDGTITHSLLMTFPSWKCLGDIDIKMVHLSKRLLLHLDLVYPVNDTESIDEADMIVPMYWKAREKAKTALKQLPRQDTILSQSVVDGSYIAKWRYSLPIAISEVVFVNFVVKCYRPFVHREAHDTHFASCLEGEFRAAIFLRTNNTEEYDDITIEVAAATKKFAWAEMMYLIVEMEKVLEHNYPGLSKHAKLKRFVADDHGKDHEVNFLMDKVEDDARLRETKAPWLPPDFNWFLQRAWTKPGLLHKLHLHHRLEVLKKLVVTNDKRRLPALWSLSYPEKGKPVEIRIYSDLSGKCWHDPLKIPITDNFFTTHSNFFKIGISVLSVASAAIPIPVVAAAVTKF